MSGGYVCEAFRADGHGQAPALLKQGAGYVAMAAADAARNHQGRHMTLADVQLLRRLLAMVEELHLLAQGCEP